MSSNPYPTDMHKQAANDNPDHLQLFTFEEMKRLGDTIKCAERSGIILQAKFITVAGASICVAKGASHTPIASLHKCQPHGTQWHYSFSGNDGRRYVKDRAFTPVMAAFEEALKNRAAAAGVTLFFRPQASGIYSRTR